MASNVFFVSWELWQQMTFVLAVCIVLVFFLGLGKLWKNNRLLAKQELLDVEKRARMSEVRKTGVSLRKGAGIPFGVRAIQGGVEVDGIWISHSTLPASKPKVEAGSVTTLIDVDASDSHGKRKILDTDFVDSGPRNSRDNRYTDVGSLDSNRSPTPRQSHLTAPRPRQARSTNALNEDTLRRLNGHGHDHSHGRPVYQTYVPIRTPRRPSQRSTASSSGDSVESQPRSAASARSASGGSYASTRSYRAPSSPREHYGRRPSGYDTPTGRTPVSPFVPTSNDNSPSLGSQQIPIPEPTFGPGDVHLNRNARRVNQGFEVLPAGTFGVSPDFRAFGDGEEMSERPAKRPRPPVQQDSSRNF